MRSWSYCVGNPAYQLSRDTTKDTPVYNNFMDEAYKIADIVEMITPARFLFNAGATPKEWNKKMLEDEHFKVLDYEPDSTKVFQNTDIKGGVAIHYRDNSKVFGSIDTFTAYSELNGIRNKMASIQNFVSLNSIMYPYSTYTLSDELWKDFPDLKQSVEHIAKNRNNLSRKEKEGKLSNLRIITTNIFDLLPDLFYDNKPNDEHEYIQLLGRQNNSRCTKWIKRKYIVVGGNFDKWKVIIPKSNGSGAIGEVLSTPLVGVPLVGYTQTYLGIGAFDTESEAKNCYKYICSKFSRVCLGILKITQDNPPEKWRYTPIQDFSSNSDIDWNASISNIDKQLYKKYGLTQKEIEFIETNVKEMQ